MGNDGDPTHDKIPCPRILQRAKNGFKTRDLHMLNSLHSSKRGKTQASGSSRSLSLHMPGVRLAYPGEV